MFGKFRAVCRVVKVYHMGMRAIVIGTVKGAREGARYGVDDAREWLDAHYERGRYSRTTPWADLLIGRAGDAICPCCQEVVMLDEECRCERCQQQFTDVPEAVQRREYERRRPSTPWAELKTNGEGRHLCPRCNEVVVKYSRCVYCDHEFTDHPEAIREQAAVVYRWN